MFAGAEAATFRQMLVAVLDHHDSGIDQYPNPQSQSAQRHHVGTYVEAVHRDEGREHRDRQRDDRHQRRTQMEQEGNAYEADDDGFQDQIPLQCLDGFIDQP